MSGTEEVPNTRPTEIHRKGEKRPHKMIRLMLMFLPLLIWIVIGRMILKLMGIHYD